jgi:hypothetical protein
MRGRGTPAPGRCGEAKKAKKAAKTREGKGRKRSRKEEEEGGSWEASSQSSGEPALTADVRRSTRAPRQVHSGARANGSVDRRDGRGAESGRAAAPLSPSHAARRRLRAGQRPAENAQASEDRAGRERRKKVMGAFMPQPGVAPSGGGRRAERRRTGARSSVGVVPSCLPHALEEEGGGVRAGDRPRERPLLPPLPASLGGVDL